MCTVLARRLPFPGLGGRTQVIANIPLLVIVAHLWLSPVLTGRLSVERPRRCIQGAVKHFPRAVHRHLGEIMRPCPLHCYHGCHQVSWEDECKCGPSKVQKSRSAVCGNQQHWGSKHNPETGPLSQPLTLLSQRSVHLT